MAHNLKSIKQKFRDNGVFYTPPELALMLKSYVDIETDEVYDPTCGDGSLLSVFPDEVKKYGQEIDEAQLNVARERLVNFEGFHGDTLEDPKIPNNDFKKRFRCIVANPPFSIKWAGKDSALVKVDARFRNAPDIAPKSRADYAFILHILHFLADDGIAVVLSAPGVLFRGAAEEKIRKWIIEQNYIDKIISVPGDTFVDTKITTVILVLRKNKTTTDIEFIDSQTQEKSVATLEKIKKEDYNLNLGRYLIAQKEQVSEEVNINELEASVRKGELQAIKLGLEFQKFGCQLRGENYNDYLDRYKKDIIEIIDSFYQQ